MGVPGPEIQIYSYPNSPYAQKVSCYLNYKRLEYEFVPVSYFKPEVLMKLTNQKQIPVVKIGEQWKKDSTTIGLWLEDLYPDRPLFSVNQEQREKLMEIDVWLSDELYTSFFRPWVNWNNKPISAILNGWKFGSALIEDKLTPKYFKWIYPFATGRVPFIKHMVRNVDMTEPEDLMHLRLENKFVELLEGGPFLGGMKHPTLADLSAYPGMVQKYVMGIRQNRHFVDNPVIAEWAKKVKSEFIGNPFLFSEKLQIRSID